MAGLEFQINPIGRSPTAFYKIGDKVTNTPYRLKSFLYKTRTNPSTGADEDISELTVVNEEYAQPMPVVLVIDTTVDSPESQALLTYEFNGKDIRVQKLGKFVLLPDTNKFYKLIDIKEGEALIQLPSGENYVVIADPRKR